MEDPLVAFNYEHQLLLDPEVEDLQLLVEEYVVKGEKLWVCLVEYLDEEVLLSLGDSIEALIQRSNIMSFAYPEFFCLSICSHCLLRLDCEFELNEESLGMLDNKILPCLANDTIIYLQ